MKPSSAHTAVPHTTANASNALPEAYILGVNPLSTPDAIPSSDTALRLGHNWREALRNERQAPVSREMQIAMLKMTEITKLATINTLRESAARTAGEHINLPEASRAEIEHYTAQFNNALPRGQRIRITKKDPLATSDARLHELRVLCADYIDQNVAEIKSALSDAVVMIREGKLPQATMAMEDCTYLAARNFVMLRNQRVSAKDATALTYDIMCELLDDVLFKQRKGPFENTSKAETQAIAEGLLSMFFTKQSVLSAH